MLSQAEFQSIAAGFDPNPGRSKSLQAAAYVDPKWLAVDREAIFYRSWQWACHVEKVREPGSYVVVEVQGRPVCIVRGVCCRFEEAGHELYATALEADYARDRHPEAPAPEVLS